MNEELMDGKDSLLEEIRQLKELLKGVREERDYLFNKLSTEKLWLQQENTQLKQQLEQLEEKYINNVPCCNENDCETFKDYMLLKQQLKDKDEKISKAIEYINKCYFDDVKIDLTGSSDLEYEQDYFKDRILEILESNKED